VEQNKNKQVLSFELGNKNVLWIADTNKYVLAEPLAANVVIQISTNTALSEIAKNITDTYSVSSDEAFELVKEIEMLYRKNAIAIPKNTNPATASPSIAEQGVYSKKTYRINRVLIGVEYESADAEWYNHPKFAHLETQTSKTPHHHFRVLESNGMLSLQVNGKNAGSWTKEDNHFLSGGFSLKIIEKIYQKEEDQWMGVFHAAGISNGKNCLMFFGDSGNGKSTLSALCMAAGFDVLSDDFLPVESKTGLVYRFPAALSIKKNAFNLVKKHYPELMDGYEYNNPAFAKIYRYLPPRETKKTAVPCFAIIEVKYDPQIEFELEEMAPDELFAKLLPDSWINASAENAKNFLMWYSTKKHFRLRYSNNKKMIDAIKNLFDEAQ
jgi:hypothetical protein